MNAAHHVIDSCGKSIELGHPMFIVAELSANYEHSLDRALARVDEVARVLVIRRYQVRCRS